MRQPIPFGKYLLLDRVSVGGMAEIFKAKSYGVEGFEKIIAIKRILPSMGEDRDFIKMFIDEAKIVGQLAHANICQIFELGRIDGAHFIAMEYIWGKDLLQIQNRLRKLKQHMQVPMGCYVVAKVCEGLDYAHKKRDPMGKPVEIVHRDCSPQNVLVSYEGEVKIIDFGIAKAASRSSRTMAGVLKGKFGYMSPEQVRGLPLDRRSDIFSLGTILYESLTGERLFQGESDFSTLEKVRNVDIQPPRKFNSSIPPEVEAIVMKALEPDVDKRYQWCNEMQADLQKFLMNQQAVFTAKALSAWMKNGFSNEVNRERQQMEGYKSVGRDGLIAGVPQAEAKLSLVENLGLAGDPEGDPTMLGGPDFEHILGKGASDVSLSDRAATINEADLPELPELIEDDDEGMDFADEAPTEIFGDGHDASDALAAAQGLQPPKMTVDKTTPLGQMSPIGGDEENARTLLRDSPIPELMAARAAAAAGAPAAAPPLAPPPATPVPTPANSYRQSAPMASQPGPMTPYARLNAGPVSYDMSPQPMSGGYPPPGGPVLNGDQPFGVTSSAQPLPRPNAMPAPPKRSPKRRRRPSIAKDIAIGVGIAAFVLGLFAAGKYFFFRDKAKAEPPPLGAMLVTVTSDGPAELFVDGEARGTVKPGEPFKVDKLTVEAAHNVKLTRDGFEPCEQTVTLKGSDVDTPVNCVLKPTPPPMGTLVLDGLTPEHEVFVDGQKVVTDDVTKPLSLPANAAHKIEIKLKDQVVGNFDVTLTPGQEERRALDGSTASSGGTPTDAVAAAGKPGDDPGKDQGKDDDERDAKRDKDKRDKGKQVAKHKPRDKKDRDKKDRKNGDKPDKKGKPDKADPDNAGKFGYLTVSSQPWARVHVDGKNTGMMTPITRKKRIKLSAGRHKVTLVVGKKKFDYHVMIKPGETKKLTKVLPVD